MMKHWMMLLAGGALAFGGAALAGSPDTSMNAPPSSSKTMNGGQLGAMDPNASPPAAPSAKDTAGSASGMTNELAGQELTGKVVRANNKTVFLDHDGVVVPLKIGSRTEFLDPSVRHGRDLKQGQDIRAAVNVKDTVNWAARISLETGIGGSGPLQDNGRIQDDPALNSVPKAPLGNGQGGSGGMGTGDVNGNIHDSTVPNHPDIPAHLNP